MSKLLDVQAEYQGKIADMEKRIEAVKQNLSTISAEVAHNAYLEAHYQRR
jgi:hypothetical protein